MVLLSFIVLVLSVCRCFLSMVGFLLRCCLRLLMVRVWVVRCWLRLLCNLWVIFLCLFFCVCMR